MPHDPQPSRSLRMGTLSAAISHLLGGDGAVRPQRRQRSGVFPGPATGARSGCSSGPESVFGLRRNGCSAWAGARTHPRRAAVAAANAAAYLASRKESGMLTEPTLEKLKTL